jgi:hypothetical protein
MLTLPIIAAVTPMASVAVGIGLLGETPRIGIAGAVGAGLAVLVTSIALAWLACSVPHPEPPEQATPPKRPVPAGPDGPAIRERAGRPALSMAGTSR